MTFEMVMAAMALLAKADRYNHPDYELEDRLREQEEREYREHIQSLKEKYPKDMLFDDFVLRCKLYIPAYREVVDCLITYRDIQVCHYEYINGEECYFLATSYWGYENPEKCDCWANPDKFNNRTNQMDATIAEALGYAISYGVYELRGMMTEKLQCEQKVNNLLHSRNITFNGSKFIFDRNGDNSGINLYKFASEGIDLDEPFVDEEEITISEKKDKVPVPYESISYANREYIVIPYPYDVCCLCITDNVIMALAIEEEMFILDEAQKTLVVKVEIRDPFAQRIMNRKDKFEQLRDDDKCFYYEVFKEASKLNDFFSNYSCCDSTREKLLEIIENGVLGKQMNTDYLNTKMQEISGKKYTCNLQGIACNGKESTLYQYCKDVYEYKEESKMGLFDSFFAGGSDTKVFNYIQNMSRTALVSAVKSEYERIKGNCRYSPAMGEFGSFEFAGALLIWKYCRENVRTNLNVCGELMITLGETIGCAYNCMSAGEWSDKIDEVINNNDLLNYTEWNQIYNYLKGNFANEIHALEFNMGKMPQQQRTEVYAGFVRTYNSLPDFKSVYDYYNRQGLRLKSDMPFNINS